MNIYTYMYTHVRMHMHARTDTHMHMLNIAKHQVQNLEHILAAHGSGWSEGEKNGYDWFNGTKAATLLVFLILIPLSCFFQNTHLCCICEIMMI